ncbi:hypothetical protein MTO96_011171 [Rhipicephalus appendiculatus]
MDLDRIVPARSASPTVHLAYQCLEGIIQNKDHVWSLLGKQRSFLLSSCLPTTSADRDHALLASFLAQCRGL